MLASRTHLRLDPLECALDVLGRAVGHFLDRAANLRRVPVNVVTNLVGVLRLNDLGVILYTLVARVNEYRRFFSVQPFMNVRHVALVGGRRVNAVHQAGVSVRADVSLHPEVPRIALLRRSRLCARAAQHLRIACLVLIRRRGR